MGQLRYLYKSGRRPTCQEIDLAITDIQLYNKKISGKVNFMTEYTLLFIYG